MKSKITYIFLVTAIFLLNSCGEHKHAHDHSEDAKTGDTHEIHENTLHINERQAKILDLQFGKPEVREMGTGIAVNGVLEIPPQSQASVSSYIGANVNSIRVIEGDKVEKGQVLASISHPDLITIQMEYLEANTEKQFQEKFFKRQQNLYKEAVISSGKFQKAEASYQAALSKWNAYQSKLKMLGINTSKLNDGIIAEEVFLKSPIEGYVRLVEVTLGKYVSPNEELFEIVNNEHIHADLMVYEKDIYKVVEGQKVLFFLGNRKDIQLEARIFSIGKSFEEAPKAVHLHADIEGDLNGLIPGTYVQGTILTETKALLSLPEDAIVEDKGMYYAFIRNEATEGSKDVDLRKTALLPGVKNGGYIAVSFIEDLPSTSDFVLNGAYYLLAEMNKSEAEHEH